MTSCSALARSVLTRRGGLAEIALANTTRCSGMASCSALTETTRSGDMAI